jgi:hypothetical protein
VIFPQLLSEDLACPVDVGRELGFNPRHDLADPDLDLSLVGHGQGGGGCRRLPPQGLKVGFGSLEAALKRIGQAHLRYDIDQSGNLCFGRRYPSRRGRPCDSSHVRSVEEGSQLASFLRDNDAGTVVAY